MTENNDVLFTKAGRELLVKLLGDEYLVLTENGFREASFVGSFGNPISDEVALKHLLGAKSVSDLKHFLASVDAN